MSGPYLYFWEVWNLAGNLFRLKTLQAFLARVLPRHVLSDTKSGELLRTNYLSDSYFILNQQVGRYTNFELFCKRESKWANLYIGFINKNRGNLQLVLPSKLVILRCLADSLHHLNRCLHTMKFINNRAGRKVESCSNILLLVCSLNSARGKKILRFYIKMKVIQRKLKDVLQSTSMPQFH